MSLTDRQSRFVQEYLLDLNATQAAARAGYSVKTANEQGARLLANVSVAQAVRQAQAARAERTQLTQDWVLERLRETVERSMQAEPVKDSEGGSTGLYKFSAAGAKGPGAHRQAPRRVRREARARRHQLRDLGRAGHRPGALGRRLWPEAWLRQQSTPPS